MFIDFHTHPLNHRYYYDGLQPAALTERDKADIRGLLAQGVERGLDAIAVTDHDLALSGLWAADEARRLGLPITVIAGCECELYHRGEWVHILALGLKEPLVYTPYTPAADLAARIHAQGALAVLAHPMAYGPAAYHSLKAVVDGVEYRNGAQARRGAADFTAVLDADGYRGLRLCGSDSHWPDEPAREQWEARTEMGEEEFLRLFGVKL
jgi:predicted metal-dependent phosphoesterase TrpH